MMGALNELRLGEKVPAKCPYCSTAFAQSTVTCPSCGEPIDMDGAIAAFKKTLEGKGIYRAVGAKGLHSKQPRIARPDPSLKWRYNPGS